MSNQDQITAWNGPMADAWVAMQDRLDRQLAPLGRAGTAALALRLGDRAADIGCGAGQTTLEIADAVGPTGRVFGVDVSAPLLARARARTTSPAIEFIEADAQVVGFGVPLDAIFSRFGVMFFADPVAGFANLARGLRPGGRLAFVCWRGFAENPLLNVPVGAGVAAGVPQPPAVDPHGPGPFAFADPARVRDVLARAGFTDVAVVPHDEAVGGNDFEQTVELALRVGPLARQLREHPEHATAAIAAVRAAIAPFTTASGVVLMPSATWIVTAARPA